MVVLKINNAKNILKSLPKKNISIVKKSISKNNAKKSITKEELLVNNTISKEANKKSVSKNQIINNNKKSVAKKANKKSVSKEANKKSISKEASKISVAKNEANKKSVSKESIKKSISKNEANKVIEPKIVSLLEESSLPKKNNANLNMINKKIREQIKLPKDKYKFYDEYLPDDIKESFKKPIGLYDPFGENINPLTNAPYENIYKEHKPIRYNSEPLKNLTVPKTYINWAYIWTNLPLYSLVGDILNSIRNNTVSIIKAGTGVGKSFLAGRICSQAFNFQKKILMTLPKKILAIETAESTAITCDVKIGEEVGYYFKGEYNIDKNNKTSKIIFTTTGSLIRKITGDDPYLSDYSCIIIDEAHERTVQTDQLILFLKKALTVRKDLKIVFISATLNVDEFKNYYKDYSFNVVDMGDGTTKKITDYYEQNKPMDWQKVAIEKVMKILRDKEEGDIIVFIKSGGDAGKMKQYLEPQIKTLNSNENPFIAVLDASVSKEDKDYAIKEFNYKTHPNQNPNKPYTRKIVFATNVAESSLTIKGAVFVIDCGLALEDMYNPTKNANALLEKFVSKSAVKQRRGRVGRTKDGVCYHLYSEKELESFIDYPLPSILKSNLTMDILDIMKIEYIKNFGDVRKLLNEMITPPEPKFIDSAILNLYSMEAISSKDDKAVLTDLGKAMTLFSGIPIYFARAIIASYYYHCKYEIIQIIVITELLKGRIEYLYTDYKPKTKLSESDYKKETEKFKKHQHRFDSKYGDFLTVLNIYTEYKKFIRAPKSSNIVKRNQNGGDINNNNNSNKTQPVTINTEISTKITVNDAKRWCNDNGFKPNIFIDSRRKVIDKVGEEVRKIERVLMDIVQPPELKNKNNNKKSTKKELETEIAMNNAKLSKIDPENSLKIGDDDIDKIEKTNVTQKELMLANKKNKSLNTSNKKLPEIIQTGGNYINYDSFIQRAGFGNKPYEKNYFPNAKMFNTKEENVLMSLAHGLYINNAKHISQKKYMTCYPIEKTFCMPDQKTSMSLTQMPAFIFYNELFMMREGQKDLKLNFITKMPTTILTEIKALYEKYIGDCYKKTSINTQHQGNNRYKGNKGHKGKNHKKQHHHKKQHYKK
jgi:HrpA-like RNA helicase